MNPLLTLAMILATVATCHAGDGKLTVLSDDSGKDVDGTKYRTITVKASRPKQGAPQMLRIDVQAKDAGQVRFATVRSSGGTVWTSSASAGSVAVWTFRVDAADMDNPKLSYEATLYDEKSGTIIDTRSRGLTNRAQWTADNTGAGKLKVAQSYEHEVGAGI